MKAGQKAVKIAKDSYEKDAWHNNIVVCGVDEVGRGCLAGPVVTAAVILPIGKRPRLIRDSKLLDAKKLNESYQWIVANCIFAWASSHHRHIDRHNIYQATLHAMERAVMQLALQEQRLRLVLVDAMPLKLGAQEVVHAPHGESWSTSIAAASIVAKVTRDALMGRVDLLIPGYSFNNHKGYATALHRRSLKDQGPSIIHRTSYLDTEEQDEHEQQTFC